MNTMTKTEVRAYMARCREALRGFEDALKNDDLPALADWAGEANGSAAALFEYVEQVEEAMPR
jgi:hypothetical protein